VAANERKYLRCGVYTRKSSEHGLEQDFNSLDAQREAAEAYIKSQAHEGWRLVKARYDDGGISGGTLERPALQSLLADIQSRKVDVVVVYKVDRLTRSLADFAKLVELFEAHGVSFVAVTQQFNTTTSMGRLTLNVLLSFAQFERELAGERIRDKFAASRRKGMWMGGTVPLGYDVKDRKLIINEDEADRVRLIFRQYLALGCVAKLRADLDRRGVRSKQRVLTSGRVFGGCSFGRGALYHLLQNRIYRGEVVHKGVAYPGEHKAIVDEELWSAVHARLAGNRTTRRKSRVETGALLGGLIYDDRGNIMSPTYSVRRGNRYRYYISSALLHDRRSDAGSRARVNADDVERMVVEALGRELSRPELSADGPSAGWSTETRTLVRDTVERVVVQCGELQVFRKPVATSATAARDEDGDAPQVQGGAVAGSKVPGPKRDYRSWRAKFLVAPIKPRSHSRHRPCQVMDARPSKRKICRHGRDRPAVPTQRRLCPPASAIRLPCARYRRSNCRRSSAPIDDGQAVASRCSRRLG